MGFFSKTPKEKKTIFKKTNSRQSKIFVGHSFRYDNRRWQVVGANKYDFGRNSITSEFELESQGEKAFLNIDNDDENTYAIYNEIDLSEIDEEVYQHLTNDDNPLEILHHGGKPYFLDEESTGHYSQEGTNEKEEFIMWDYYDETREKILSITQWDDTEFDASVGRILNDKEVQIVNS